MPDFLKSNQFTKKMDNKTIGILIAIIIFAVLAWVGFNFLNPIKVAPINLVPSGSTAATNPTSQAVINATAGANAGAQIAYNNAQNSYAQAQQNNLAFGALGAGLGGLLVGLGGNEN